MKMRTKAVLGKPGAKIGKTATKAGTKIGGKGARGLSRASYAAGRLSERTKKGGRTTRTRVATKTRVALGLAAGAAGAFFLDPQNGKRRRHVTRDKALKLVRRGAAETERKVDYAAGKVEGAVAEQTPSARDAEQDLNDPALARKVESEIFRGPEAPKDKVSVNVENGVVYLRGEVSSPGQAGALAQAARRVDGVQGVESLLHLPSEPPKSKDGQPKAPTS